MAGEGFEQQLGQVYSEIERCEGYLSQITSMIQGLGNSVESINNSNNRLEAIIANLGGGGGGGPNVDAPEFVPGEGPSSFNFNKKTH